jgi:hypothetical protein
VIHFGNSEINIFRLGSFTGVKQQEREADHSLISHAEVKNGGAIIVLPLMVSWRSAQLIKHRDKHFYMVNRCIFYYSQMYRLEGRAVSSMPQLCSGVAHTKF